MIYYPTSNKYVQSSKVELEKPRKKAYHQEHRAGVSKQKIGVTHPRQELQMTL